jgi:aspartyl/asparaginyl-tRNA synthetase
MGFIDFDDLLKLISGMVNRVADDVWAKYEVELKKWNAAPPKLPAEIPRLPLAEIHELYTKATKIAIDDLKDLTPDEERWVCEYAKKNLGSDAVFVVDWPADSMKFYHRRSAENPELAERADLLFRGIEIATISMREHRYDVLVEQLKTLASGDPDDPGFVSYLSAFKFGMPPHGGFGLGMERLTEKLVGLNNVKEATLFPRDINRLAP